MKSGIAVCLGITVASAADMYLMVIFFELGQIIFEGFNALLKQRFSFPNAMNENVRVSLYGSLYKIEV